jgi:hypothetical protein
VLDKLRASYPNITFMLVDWDTYKNHEITSSRRIPRRSTLVLIKGDKELGRIVAGTSERDIRDLLDKGL